MPVIACRNTPYHSQPGVTWQVRELSGHTVSFEMLARRYDPPEQRLSFLRFVGCNSQNAAQMHGSRGAAGRTPSAGRTLGAGRGRRTSDVGRRTSDVARRTSGALEPRIHGVRTHWIRGFMAFQLGRRTRNVVLMVSA